MSPIGDRVGPFQLESLLSEGEGVSLYRAVRPEGSREPRVVAIRMANHPSDTAAAALIRNEYEVLNHLNDARIPRTHGFYASQPAVSISHYEGMSLAQVVHLWKEDALHVDVSTAIDILLEIAQALRSAHSTRREGVAITHGHLGSQNVLLTASGRIVVQGFGSSPRGTFAAFTPPEQAAGAFIDSRSDQWTLGAIGVELLLGERLYTGVTDRREAALSGDVERWLLMLERRFPAASRVLGRMLAPAAGDRYPSSSELVADLLALSRQCSGPADRVRLASTAWNLLYAEEEPPATQPDAPAPAPAPAIVESIPDSGEVEVEDRPTVAMVSPQSNPTEDSSEAPTVAITPEETQEPPQVDTAAVVAEPAQVVLSQEKPVTDGPRLVHPGMSEGRSGPSLVPPPSSEELEPTEMIAATPTLATDPSEDPDESSPKPSVEETIEELKRMEMAAFIMVGILVLVAVIFLAVRFG